MSLCDPEHLWDRAAGILLEASGWNGVLAGLPQVGLVLPLPWTWLVGGGGTGRELTRGLEPVGTFGGSGSRRHDRVTDEPAEAPPRAESMGLRMPAPMVFHPVSPNVPVTSQRPVSWSLFPLHLP